MKLFKKSTTVLFIAFALLMSFSCSSDDDDDNGVVHPLVGVWEYSQTGDNWELTVRLTFNNNKTGIIFERYSEDDEIDENSFNFAWNTVGNELTVTSEDVLNLTYSIDGDELELTGVFDEGGEEETMIFMRK